MSIETLQGLQAGLIRKALAGSFLTAPYATALPTSFTTGTTATLNALTGFDPIGHLSREGAPTFTPEVESNDVESWGVAEPPRTDIIAKRTTVSFTGQETHLKNFELYHGIDLSQHEADATTGEFAFNEPVRPALIYRRAIFFAVDGDGADAIFIFKVMPKFTVTEVGEQSWSTENPIEYPITGRALFDETAGFGVRHVFGGPGWKARLADMGITQATP